MADTNKRYVKHLQMASYLERVGKIAGAIKSLEKAEKATFDSDELQHLRVWKSRLARQVTRKVAVK